MEAFAGLRLGIPISKARTELEHNTKFINYQNEKYYYVYTTDDGKQFFLCPRFAVNADSLVMKITLSTAQEVEHLKLIDNDDAFNPANYALNLRNYYIENNRPSTKEIYFSLKSGLEKKYKVQYTDTSIVTEAIGLFRGRTRYHTQDNINVSLECIIDPLTTNMPAGRVRLVYELSDSIITANGWNKPFRSDKDL